MGKRVKANDGKGHPATSKAETLLALHVQYEMQAFEPARFLPWVEEELRTLWPRITAMTLESLISRKNVMATIQRNVIERTIPGAVAEIAGEAATGLFGADFHLNTQLSEITSTKKLEEFVDKALELNIERDTWLRNLVQQPVYGELISDVVYRALVRYLTRDNILSKKVPGVKKMVSLSTRMVTKTLPKLEGAVEQNVKAFIADNTHILMMQSQDFLNNSLSDEELKAFALSFWHLIEGQSFREIQQGINAVDLSEFVVLGYEFWHRFRKTDYFARCCEFVVNHLFDKYGAEPLEELLSDFAVTPDSVLAEMNEFAPGILLQIRENGVLESVLRRRLSGFYQTNEVLDVLASTGND